MLLHSVRPRVSGGSALTAQLIGAAPITARARMRISVAMEMIFGALVITAAAFLASLTPGFEHQP